MKKKTLVLGASPNPARYAYTAVSRLVAGGHEAIPLGIKAGQIAGIDILNELRLIEDIHTISLYLSPIHQPAYYDYILSLNPQRLIFNPGTENTELVQLAREQGICVVGISDSPASPIILRAQHGFVVAADTPQFFPSSVSTIALLETLLSFVIAVSSDEIVGRVEKFHHRRHQLGIYHEDKA